MTASLRPVGGDAAAVLELLEPWVRDGGAPLVVRTSGSSGEPKDVVLSHGAVMASARATLDRLGGPGQWLLAIPMTGVGGLQVLVRSLLAGYEPVLLTSDGGLGAAVDSMTAARRYVSLVPTQLYRLAAAGDLDVLRGFGAVLVGGAAADVRLINEARSAGVRVVRTYGMTETCGGCVYDGVPLDGVEVRIDDGGQILLRGPMLFDGYADRPHPEGAWFATADRGEFDADGRLRVFGRLDHVVVSGGVNVPIDAVESAIRGLPEVAEVAVVGVPDPEWGSRVVAAVVATPGSVPTHTSIRDGVEAAGLARTWAPRQVLVLPELPVGATGKVDRTEIRRLAT